ncbi:lipopolysaccharide biosynthesis protein [Ruminococcus albus]|uniref:lipopolysaccharide biosynthesis protein n=1 Tax=Ruminococcus albus TaxID=1264 RepID=UPI0004B89EFB|nr:oligosaccharide flippase family protein [Ruminococcus albus]
MNTYINKVRGLPQGVKASIAFFIANIITKGIGYITTPLYTRLLSTEQYGQTSVFLTWLQVFGIIAMYCLSYGVFNNGMIDYPEKRDEYSLSMLVLSNIITVCFSGIILCIYPLISQYLKMSFSLLVLMCLIFLFQPAYNFWMAKQRYELKYKFSVLWSLISAFCSPLIAIICILLFPEHRLYARIFGAEIALLLIYIGFYVHLIIKAKGKIITKYWMAALLFNLPLIPHYLSTYLLGSADKIMISNIINDTATAYYSVAYSVASVAIIIWTAANSSLIPFTYEKCKIKDYKAISNVTIPILIVFGAACIFIILLAPEVVAIMASKEYKEAIYVIPPIVGGVFFQVHYYIYANVLYYYKKPKFVMIGSFVATVLNVVLNFIFIKQYGYIAAGYTTIFCYFVQALIDYFAMRYVVGESIYDMRIIVGMSVFLTIISIFSNLTYDYVIIRYVVVIVLLIVGILNSKKMISLFKGLKKG